MTIRTDEEYHKSREYIEMMENVLLSMRRAHTPEEYEVLKRGWLDKIQKAQADIVRYLSEPATAAATASERTRA
jgi:hypothetical protein